MLPLSGVVVLTTLCIWCLAQCLIELLTLSKGRDMYIQQTARLSMARKLIMSALLGLVYVDLSSLYKLFLQ